MKKIIFIFVIVIGCGNPYRNDLDINLTPQEYYKLIPDAPIDLYCLVDNAIDVQLRDSLCKHIMFNLSGNLSFDLGFVIKENQIDTIEIQALYFDNDGNNKKDTLSSILLSRIFNEIDLQKINTMKNIVNEDFALRMQLERLCIGHVSVYEPKIESIIKSIRENSEK